MTYFFLFLYNNQNRRFIIMEVCYERRYYCLHHRK
nr:MAG TPA_asm: hypothetical protein [Caudoviricetes sp.]DAV95112.1 MAG TPA: hypothetical protein [Caudoviricetes sp.]DAW98206.1 MAG TPA: hypothetical protein [Bacteriophage sp.]